MGKGIQNSSLSQNWYTRVLYYIIKKLCLEMNDELLNLPVQVVQYCWLNACNSIHSATVNTVLSHIKYIIVY